MSADDPWRDLAVIMHRLPLAEVYRPFDALAVTKVILLPEASCCSQTLPDASSPGSRPRDIRFAIV